MKPAKPSQLTHIAPPRFPKRRKAPTLPRIVVAINGPTPESIAAAVMEHMRRQVMRH